MLEISQKEYYKEEIDEGLSSDEKNEDETEEEQENYEEDKIDPFSQYLLDMGKFDLITVEEEKRLWEIIQLFLHKEDEIFEWLIDWTIKLSWDVENHKLLSSIRYLKNVENRTWKIILKVKDKRAELFRNIKLWKKANLIMDEEEKEFFYKLREYWEQAIDKFAKANLRLVIKIALDYKNKSWWLSISDLIQEWNIWLLKAVRKFNPESENKFSTYAAWWIRQAISSAILSKTGDIYVPKKDKERLSKITSIKRKFIQKEWRFPTDEELAIKSETSIEEMTDFLKRVSILNKGSLISIDSPIWSHDESFTVEDTLVDTSIQPEQKIQLLNVSEIINKILIKLDKREKNIIELRFWLNWNEEHTLDEIWKKIGVTKEAIRQTQVKVIKRLKKIIEGKNIQEDDIF